MSNKKWVLSYWVDDPDYNDEYLQSAMLTSSSPIKWFHEIFPTKESLFKYLKKNFRQEYDGSPFPYTKLEEYCENLGMKVSEMTEEQIMHNLHKNVIYRNG